MQFFSDLKRIETAFPPYFRFPEFKFTQPKLTSVCVRLFPDRKGHFFQPGFSVVSSLIESDLPLMIGQIEIVRVIFGYAAFHKTDMAVPADEINGIIKVLPVCVQISCVLPVNIPCAVNGLGISVGRGKSGSGKDKQTDAPPRPGIGSEI